MQTRVGIFGYVGLIAGVDTITADDKGKICYLVDDQTVALTNGGGTRSPAGVIYDVQVEPSETTVWVELLYPNAGLVVAAASGSSVTGAANLDAEGLFTSVSGGNIQLKGITGNTVTATGTTVNVNVPVTAGQHLGGTQAVFAGLSATSLQFKGLTAGAGGPITVTADASQVFIQSSAKNNDGVNLGSAGANVVRLYVNRSDEHLNFRRLRLLGTYGATLSENGDYNDLTINAPAVVTTAYAVLYTAAGGAGPLSAGSDVTFDSSTVNGLTVSSSKTINLLAGKKYKLTAMLAFDNFSQLAAGDIAVSLVDATNNTPSWAHGTMLTHCSSMYSQKMVRLAWRMTRLMHF